MSKLFFSTIEVTRQVFYRTPLSFAIVNLKPIVPGHVLVVPSRVVPRLTDLQTPELADLMTSIQTVGNVIERAYGADGLTIACQDGKAAGQTVPHVHFHILPRKLKGDRFASNNDEVYPALERAEGSLPRELQQTAQQQKAASANGDNGLVERSEPLRMDADDDRKPRTLEEMEKEAEWLKGFFQSVNSDKA